MYEWKPPEPMSPEQIAQQEAHIARQDAAIARGRKTNRVLGILFLIVGLACVAIGLASLLLVSLDYRTLILPVLGGAVMAVKGLDYLRKS